LNSPEAVQLCQKFNETTTELSGFAPRSPNLWSEIYSNQESRLFLAKEEKRTLGYLIVSLHYYATARLANISELCIWERKEETAKALITKAQSFAKQMNATALISWENHEGEINQAFYQFGFFDVGRSVFSVGVMSLGFIRKTLGSKKRQVTVKQTRDAKRILVDLGKKKFPSYSGTFVAGINPDGTVSVEEKESTEKPYARVQTDIVTFSEIMLAIRNPLLALLLGRIKIRPISKTLAVIKILKYLSCRVSWYLPLGDYF